MSPRLPRFVHADITVEKGRVKIDGGYANPVTQNFICAKVRRFGERIR